MNRKQKLLKKLAALADELDIMGETKLVDMITEGLKTVAATEPSADMSQSSSTRSDSVVMPEAKVMGETDKQKIRRLNMKAQEMLSSLLSRRGEGEAIRTDGVFDEKGKEALREFAGAYPQDYKNWAGLFANLESALQSYKGHGDKPMELSLDDDKPGNPAQKPKPPTLKDMPSSQPAGDPNWQPPKPIVDFVG